MSELRTTVLRIASDLPKGDATRKKLLAALNRKARLNGRVFSNGSYLQKFFDEKGVPEKDFTVIDNRGVEHTIPNGVVLEYMAKTTGSERKKIEDTLRQIDFRNGDVNHFLEFLAKPIADMYEGALRFAGHDQQARALPPGVHLIEDLSSTLGDNVQLVFRERGSDLLRSETDPGYYLTVGGILKRLHGAETMSPRGETAAKKALTSLLRKL